MTSLVTGAYGFIGSHMVKTLIDKGEEVVALVYGIKMNDWLWEALKEAKTISGDIRDFRFIKSCLNHHDVDKVYHFAAEAIVKRAWKDPIGTYDVNIMGTVKVLEACRQLDIKNILIQSTDKVYGDLLNAEVDDLLTHGGPYETSKVAVDYIAQSYGDMYEMDVVVARTCNVYGYDLNSRIIPNTIRACLRGESPVIFKTFLNKVDQSIRQYIYVSDACDAYRHLVSQKMGSMIANVATHDVLSQEDVVLKILDVGFPELEPSYVKRQHVLDEIEKQSIRPSEFGWKPKYSFREGIEETIDRFMGYGY